MMIALPIAALGAVLGPIVLAYGVAAFMARAPAVGADRTPSSCNEVPMPQTLPAKYAYVASPDAPETIKQALKVYGTAEVPGNGNNQIILNWAAEVEKATGLPHLGYTADEIPWCGLFAALVCSRAGYASQIIKTPLWAPSWINFGDASPVPSFGDIMVFSRNGGGHVSFYVGEDDLYYHILGGNQSDMVDIMQEPKIKFTAARRPRWGAGGQPASVRKIIVGASGPAIAPIAAPTPSLPPTDPLGRRKWIQERVGVTPDGVIGPQSEAAIAAFIAKVDQPLK